jgi:hypothetical protein
MCAACLYIENHESESLLYQIPPFFSGLLVGQERYAEAERVLLEAWETQKTAIAKNALTAEQTDHFREGLICLIQICTATNRSEDGENWRKILAKVPDPMVVP